MNSRLVRDVRFGARGGDRRVAVPHCASPGYGALPLSDRDHGHWGMTDSTSTRPLVVVLTELGWKPEVLARQLNSFAALQGRVERMHAKTPYKWLRGDRPLSRGPR